MARLLAQILQQLGLRTGGTFHETDGGKLVQAGAKKFTDEVVPKVGGSWSLAGGSQF